MKRQDYRIWWRCFGMFHNKAEVQMSRNLILATGALLWSLVAIEAVVHVITGYWAANAIVAIVGVSWVTLRRARWSPIRAE